METDQLKWRQGSVVCGLDLIAITRETKVAEFYVVSSHDCDQNSEDESDIEVLCAEYLSKPDGNLTQGKSSRKMHLQCVDDRWIEIRQAQKRTFSKSVRSISTTSEVRDKKLFARWLANRYQRTPLPNSFEDRLKNAKSGTAKLSNDLKNLFQKDCVQIFGFYISLGADQSEELNATQTYKLTITVVADVLSGKLDADAQLQVAASVAKKLKNLIESADWDPRFGSINLLACVPTTEIDFSLFDSRRLSKWNLDFFSGTDA